MAIKKADILTVPSIFLKERLGLDNSIVIPNAIFIKNFLQTKHSDKDMVNIVTITKFSFLDKACGVLNILDVRNVQKYCTKKFHYTVIGGGIYLDKSHQ